MKQKLIQLTLVALAWSGLILSAQGADLIVEENGVAPNYNTISAAISAASNGDRIFIKNKVGNIPYQENVTLDKSLELLPFDADGFFYVQGTYTINPASGRTITIIGMNNSLGSINGTVNNPGTNATRVNVLGCQLSSGSINLSGTNYVSHVAGNQLNAGSVTVRYATVAGNQLNSGSITFSNVSTGSLISNDSLYIVGNKLLNGQIRWDNTSHYFYIANNYINRSSANIDINAFKTNGTHIIYNNSIRFSSYNSNGIYLVSVPANTNLEIQNNAFESTSNQGLMEAISFGGVSGFCAVHYNVHERMNISAGSSGNTSFTNNVYVSSATLINTTSGECTAAQCIDQGNPGTSFIDLDLSINNRGAAGGSLNINNFFPILTGGARVYLVTAPRTVVNSSTIRADAFGHDR